MQQTLISIAATAILTTGIVAPAVVMADGHSRFPNSVTATTHMVSAANPLASQAGLDVLEAGGTAMDAAVAVQFMLNLVEPESSGIGGGAFLLYWDAASNKLLTYDGREKAPASATAEYFFKDGEPMKWSDARPGGLSVGVPGTLKLLEVAHQAHGRQHWTTLIQPTIEQARSGFKINAKMARAIAGAAERGLMLFDETKSYFLNDDGSPKEEGTLLTNDEFADTLTLIAAFGADAFYTGPIAKSIVDATRTETNTGQMTLEDLSSYKVIQRDPVCADYRAYHIGI